MKIQIFLLSCSVFLLFSCIDKGQNDSANQNAVTEVDVKTLSDNSDLFDSWYYIPLQQGENGEGLVGDILSIDFDNEYIIIRSDPRNINLFDRKGNFIRCINRQGQGPEEYLNAGQIRLHDGKIYVLPAFQQILQVYNLDGTHVRSYTLPTWFVDFEVTDKNKVILASQLNGLIDYDVIELDLESGKITGQYLPMEANRENAMFHAHKPIIANAGDKCYVTQPFNHTIYEIGENGLSEYKTYDFNTSVKLSDVADKKSTREKYDATMSSDLVHWLGPRYEDKDVSFQTFTICLKPGGVIRHIYRETKEGDDLFKIVHHVFDPQYPLLGNMISFDRDYYVSAIDQSVVREREEKHNINIVKEDLDDEGNPFLVFHHLKH